MSLKSFHIFFIMISIVTAIGFGAWCFWTEAGRAVEGSSIMGTVSFVLAILLAIYGYKFLRKVERGGLD